MTLLPDMAMILISQDKCFGHFKGTFQDPK